MKSQPTGTESFNAIAIDKIPAEINNALREKNHLLAVEPVEKKAIDLSVVGPRKEEETGSEREGSGGTYGEGLQNEREFVMKLGPLDVHFGRRTCVRWGFGMRYWQMWTFHGCNLESKKQLNYLIG